MIRVLRMPHVSDDATTAVLAEWLVDEASAFEAGQAVATVETNRALVKIEASRGGVLLRALAVPGAAVAEGMSLAMLGDPGDIVDDGEVPAPDPLLDDGVIREPLVRRVPRRVDAVDAAAPGAAHDLHLVERVHSALTTAPVAPSGEVDAHRPTHLSLAGASEPGHPMSAFTGHATIPAAPLLALLAELRAEPEQNPAGSGDEPELTMRLLVIKAVAAAVRRSPELAHAPTAITIATERGAVTAVVREPGSLTMLALAAAVKDLESRATSDRLRPDEAASGVAVTVVDGDPDAQPTSVSGIVVGILQSSTSAEPVLSISVTVVDDAIPAATAARWTSLLLDALQRPVRLLA